MKRIAAPALGLVVMMGLGSPLAAQGFNFGGQSNDAPVQLSADEGIEWQSEGSRVIAKGHAKASRGAMSVSADSLTAYYRQGKDGDEIWRIDADGDVVITNATEKATGHKATYDLDKQVVVLLGKPARLTTPTEEVIAHDALEYWEQKKMAVARGDAKIQQKVKQQSLHADVIVAHFKDDRKKSQELDRAEAYGKVVVKSASDTANGDKGTYDAKTGMATLAGNVRLVRAENTLQGGYVQINLNSGISKIFPAVPGTASAESQSGRVQGTFVPEKSRTQATFSGAKPSSRSQETDHGR